MTISSDEETGSSKTASTFVSVAKWWSWDLKLICLSPHAHTQGHTVTLLSQRHCAFVAPFLHLKIYIKNYIFTTELI